MSKKDNDLYIHAILLLVYIIIGVITIETFILPRFAYHLSKILNEVF